MTDPNFSCSDPALLRGNVTERVWMVLSEGSAHENSIIAIAAFQILFVVIGIPWNSIVFIAIIKKRLYNQPTYLLLLNLIVSDLLVCVCVMPFNIASAIAKEFTIGDSDYARCQVCHTIVIIIITLIYVSQFSIALMSVDRLVYIKRPMRYPGIITVKRVIIVLLALWIFCITISILPVFGIGEHHFSNKVGACSLIVGGKTHLTSNINYVVFLTVVAILPFTITLVTDVWLLVIVCKKVRMQFGKDVHNAKSQCSSTLQRLNVEDKLKVKLNSRHIRLTYLFGAIFAGNTATWIPTFFIAVISVIIGSENVPPAAFAFQYLAFLSQPAFHPILMTCLVGKATSIIFMFICPCKKKRKDTNLNKTPNSSVWYL